LKNCSPNKKVFQILTKIYSLNSHLSSKYAKDFLSWINKNVERLEE
jgi:hypothetical protein